MAPRRVSGFASTPPSMRLAGGMGVEAARATTLEQCADLLAQSCAQQAPFLIELMI